MNYRTKLLNYFRQRDRGWLLSLFALVCLTYMPFLGNPFIFDDIGLFHNGGIADYSNTLYEFKLRWLPYATLVWTATLFSDALTHFFHLGNMLLHAGTVILLFYLLRGLLGISATDPAQQRTIVWGAWLASLLFAVHPLAVYAVGYVIQRSILMAAFFSLLMLLGYLRALQTGRERWLIVVVLAYFMAGFCKEHSVLMPAVLAALHILISRGSNKLFLHKLDKRALWLCWGAMLIIAVLVTLMVKGVVGAAYEPLAAAIFAQQDITASGPLLHLLSVMTQAGLFFKYLLLCLLPNPAWMSIDMREHFITSLAAWQGWLGIIAFLAYGLLALRLLLRGDKQGLLGFALLYPWLLFLIEFSSIRVQEPFVLYRSYLWMPGLMLLVPLLLLKLPSRRTMLVLGLAVLLLLPLAWNRLWTFSDNYHLWNDAALLLPNEKVAGADRIFFNRGQAEAKAQQWDKAAADFTRVVIISPKIAPARNELGKAYLNLGKFTEALEQFNAGIAMDPEDGSLNLGRGMALMRLHESEQALKQFIKTCGMGEQTACMLAGWLQLKK